MRRALRGLVAAVALAGVAAALRPGTRGNAAACRALDRGGRRLRYLAGQLRGMSYRLRGRHPDPAVDDNVLADRIRSSLGGLERRLDVPRIHVMVEHHVALLHGEVGTEEDAATIERAVAAISGVAGVESYLHAGLTRGDARPSTGRAVHPPSPALTTLREAAERAGAQPGAVDAVLRAVLATFADRLPAGERARIGSHLPSDVRSLLAPPRRIRHEPMPRTVTDLVSRVVVATSELPWDQAGTVTEAVLHALRRLVPEDAGGVAAVLPAELRDLWQGAS